MWFNCPCGNTISDTTDSLPNKAHVLADQDVELFMDELEVVLDRLVLSLGGSDGWKGSRGSEPVEVKSSLEHDAKWLLWQAKSRFLKHTIYQCPNCLRLSFSVGDAAMRTFVPEEPARSKRILSSALGDAYPVRLSGNWHPTHSKGDLFWNSSGSESGGFEQFTDFATLEARYRQVFEDLRRRNKLESAWLRDGDTMLMLQHWPDE